MTPSPRATQDLPESPYARELEGSHGDMKFSPALEREYHRFYPGERRSHVRSFNRDMLLLAAAAAGSRSARPNMPRSRPVHSGYGELVERLRAKISADIENPQVIGQMAVRHGLRYPTHADLRAISGCR